MRGNTVLAGEFEGFEFEFTQNGFAGGVVSEI